MRAFSTESPNVKTAVDQLAKTRPRDAARVFIPGGDQIIGGGPEEITISFSDVQAAFNDITATLEEEGSPIVEQVEAL